jgi:hypothetical protein
MEDKGQRCPRSAVLCRLSSVFLFLVCGCDSDPGKGMANAYYLSPDKDLRRLGRVTLVEMEGVADSPEIAAAITDALFLEVQKKQVFSVTMVRRDDPAWRGLQENLDSQAPRQLGTLRETLGCNGLIVGTVTRYQPYPHLAIGLRLKLIDLADGQLLWGLEQVWDSSDKDIGKRVKGYLKAQQRSGHSPLSEDLVLVSPLSFCKFVAYEVAWTLQRPKK